MSIIIKGSVKTYTHSQGLSCCFRQWRAESHCRFLHGYALQVTIDFVGGVDKNGWVVDFGRLKAIKQFLELTFDHKLVIAESDPKKDQLHELALDNLACVVIMPEVGCENFAKYIMDYVDNWIGLNGIEKVYVRKVTVAEHGGNSAYVERQIL